MQPIKLLDNQRIIDIAMQELGDVERIFEIAILNGKSITDDFITGDVLVLPDFDSAQTGTISILKTGGLQPASSYDELLSAIPPGGVGFMDVQGSFIVS